MDSTRPNTVGAGSLGTQAAPDALFANDTLLRLLAAVRGSSIPKDERMQLRDLVLEYSQVTDPSEKKKVGEALQAALAPHRSEFAHILGESTQPAKARAPEPNQNELGRTRPQPVFQATQPTKEPQPATEAPKPPQEQKIPVRVEQTEPVAPKRAAPEPTPVAPEQVPEQPPAPAAGGDAKTRISEIKRSVNEHVGNPVNLVEKNREVGQEYMAALLEAMKRSSGGGGINEAMKRLEAAYAAVEQFVENERFDTKKSEPAPPPEPKQEPVKEEPEPEKAPAQQPNTSPAPPQKAPEVTKQKSPREIASEARIDIKIPRPDRSRRDAAPAPQTPPPPKQNTSDTPTRDARKLTPLSSLQSSQSKPPPQNTAPKPQPQAKQKQEGQEQSKTEQKQATPQPTATPDGTGLNSPKITAGLEQLLSEWSLFKSSGIFGTGPSGVDHPLYKKLAHLPMAAVVAGRFEGATPEIRQTLADYMNGWRYEQGIVHKMEEQFEHYLRRVIEHIIEKQQKYGSEE